MGGGANITAECAVCGDKSTPGIIEYELMRRRINGAWKGLNGNDDRRKHKADEATERPYPERIRAIGGDI